MRWGSSLIDFRTCVKWPTTDRLPAIAPSSRAFRNSTCRSPCGATTGAQIRSTLGHQLAELVLTFAQPTPAGATAEHVDLAPGSVERWPGNYRDRAHRSDDRVLDREWFADQMSARGAQAWAARGGTRFSSPQGEGVFSGERGRRSFTSFRPAGDTARYEEVRPAATPLPAQDYVGEYASDELDVRLTIVARGGKLFVRRRPADEFELSPAYADDFHRHLPAGSALSVSFAMGVDASSACRSMVRAC